ncbi:SCP-like protein, partial [Ancylostoma caninum]
ATTATPGATTAAPGATTAAPGATTATPGATTAAPGATTAAPGATTTVTGGPATTAASGSTNGTNTTRKPWPKPNCDSHDLTNGLRALFLNMHNNHRGKLARGQTEVSAGWGIAPPAALMYRMRYSCDAESYAVGYVAKCERRGLPEYTHPGYKANLHVLRTTDTTEAGAIQNVGWEIMSGGCEEFVKTKICWTLFQALVSWWSELARFGMRSNMMFYRSEFKRGARSVLNWSKMAWWNNKEIGCAVRKCDKFYLTACMYTPGGNDVDQHVYKVGAVCSDCPEGQCDSQALCRW